MSEKPLALDLCCGLGGWTIGLQAAGWEVVGVDIERWEGYPGDHLIVGDVRHLKASAAWKRDVKLVCASPPCQEFSYRSFPFKKCIYLRDHVPPDKSIWEACVRIAKECVAPLILENVKGAEGCHYKHPEWFMGPAKSHYGSFYLWGDVPPLLPIGRPVKGFQQKKMEQFAQARTSAIWPKSGEETRKTQWRGNVQGDKPKHWHGGFAGEMDRVVPVYNGKKMVGSEKYASFGGSHMERKRPSGGKLSGKGAAQVGHHNSNARKAWSAKAAMIPIELSTWIGQVFHP